jgi:hypothetical protein
VPDPTTTVAASGAASPSTPSAAIPTTQPGG